MMTMIFIDGDDGGGGSFGWDSHPFPARSQFTGPKTVTRIMHHPQPTIFLLKKKGNTAGGFRFTPARIYDSDNDDYLD